MLKKETFIFNQLKKSLKYLLFIAIIGELVLFPSLQNLLGCCMALTSYWIFCFFLTRKYVLLYPFAFMMYLSMFLYRYLPLIATLSEFKPITYGFQMPYETIVFETILFLISSLAFYIACSIKKRNNNFIQLRLKRLSFFEINIKIIWVLGIVGTLIRLYNFSSGDVEYGDVGGKFLLGLDYLMYAPLSLFFPDLLRLKQTKTNKILIIYSIAIFVLNIMSNSRRQIIIPFGIYLLLFFLHIVKNNINISQKISIVKLGFIVLLLFYGLNFLSNLSIAMLFSRSIRADVSKEKLLNETLKVYNDENLMEKLRSLEKETLGSGFKYSAGWTEEYIDNFMLNRYANMRITDQTIYYAEKLGYDNKKMKTDLVIGLLVLLPTPILNILNFHIDKSTREYSRGDLIYGKGIGGYRVTSHVGDGLATFGYFYFPIQGLVFFFVFSLLNSLVFYTQNGVIYPLFGILNIFTFLGMFRNANGITFDLSYCIRGFWEGCFTYIVLFYIVKNAVSFANTLKIKTD